MTVELYLGPEVERRLRCKAAAGGVTLEAYLRTVVEHASQTSENADGATTADVEEDRPWRGVLVLPWSRRAAFSPRLECPALALPRREPVPNMNWHRVSADDE